MSREVRQLPLAVGDGAIDAVEDQRVALFGAHAGQPAHERIGLVAVADGVQRVEGERCVAQPGEAVVPVALAADRFRQRGGWGGDDGARGVVREQLEGDRAAHDEVAVAAVVGVGGIPLLPEGDRAVHPGVGILEGHGAVVMPVAVLHALAREVPGPVVEHDGHLVTLVEVGGHGRLAVANRSPRQVAHRSTVRPPVCSSSVRRRAPGGPGRSGAAAGRSHTPVARPRAASRPPLPGCSAPGGPASAGQRVRAHRRRRCHDPRWPGNRSPQVTALRARRVSRIAVPGR